MLEQSLTIRPLIEADADAFRTLRLEAIQDSPMAIWPTLEEERAKPHDVVHAQIRHTERQVVWGAFDGEALVGIAGMRREPFRQLEHKALLWGVFVRPAYRKCGIARELLNHAFARAREQGVLQVSLCVNAENDRAQRLYASIGFVSYGIEPRALRVDGRYFDEKHMMLYLDRGAAS
ncbi:GNAT family N-acetyltransferase [Paraburkholderia phymatum]|uniref:GNAT family N-acetyltransferase n=1 Tax=Paraburkholderia phymatum TaxID=148447 RepID=UPI003180F932